MSRKTLLELSISQERQKRGEMVALYPIVFLLVAFCEGSSSMRFSAAFALRRVALACRARPTWRAIDGALVGVAHAGPDKLTATAAEVCRLRAHAAAHRPHCCDSAVPRCWPAGLPGPPS